MNAAFASCLIRGVDRLHDGGSLSKVGDNLGRCINKYTFYGCRLCTSSRNQNDTLISGATSKDGVGGYFLHWIDACNMKCNYCRLQMHQVGNSVRNSGVSPVKAPPASLMDKAETLPCRSGESLRSMSNGTQPRLQAFGSASLPAISPTGSEWSPEDGVAEGSGRILGLAQIRPGYVSLAAVHVSLGNEQDTARFHARY